MTTSYRPTVPPSEPGPVRLRAQRPADLLATVPFLLGFHLFWTIGGAAATP